MPQAQGTLFLHCILGAWVLPCQLHRPERAGEKEVAVSLRPELRPAPHKGGGRSEEKGYAGRE